MLGVRCCVCCVLCSAVAVGVVLMLLMRRICEELRALIYASDPSQTTRPTYRPTSVHHAQRSATTDASARHI
jgi:hypothetical protein